MSSTIFKERVATPGSLPEPLPGLEIERPSGEIFERPPFASETSPVLENIDTAIERYGASEKTAAYAGRIALLGEVQLMAQAFPEQWDKAGRHNARILGRAALALAGQETSQTTEEKQLSELFEIAYKGDETAGNALDTDAASDVIEMVCKTGTEMTSLAQIVDGQIIQYGRSTAERQYNTRVSFSYRFAGLDDMSRVEGQNALSIEKAIAEGKFKKGDTMLECSLVPNAPHAALKGSGLFLREVVAIIRTTTLGHNNEVIIKSYLVRGTDARALPPLESVKRTKAGEEAVEQQALANRFDIAVFRKLFHRLGVMGAATMSPTDMLATPFYIPGHEGRTTVEGVDIAMLFDEITSEELGGPVMMGSAELYQQATGGNPRPLTKQDYLDHFTRMETLQKELRPLGKQARLRATARWQEVVGDDYAAGRLLHEMAADEVMNFLARSIVRNIERPDAKTVMPDLTAMGIRSYLHLLDFQNAVLAGNMAAANRAFRLADEEKDPTGCPLGQKRKLNKDGLDLEGDGMNELTQNDDKDTEQDSKTGKIRCIQCRRYVHKADVIKKDCWECPKCRHKVDVCTGKVLREGISTAAQTADKPVEKTKTFTVFAASMVAEESPKVTKKSQVAKAA